MTYFSKVEQSFTVRGRGRVIVPASVANRNVRVRNGDAIQLRTLNGNAIETRIVSVESVKETSGSRLALLLPLELGIGDIAAGTEIWVK